MEKFHDASKVIRFTRRLANEVYVVWNMIYVSGGVL